MLMSKTVFLLTYDTTVLVLCFDIVGLFALGLTNFD